MNEITTYGASRSECLKRCAYLWHIKDEALSSAAIKEIEQRLEIIMAHGKREYKITQDDVRILYRRLYRIRR